MPSFPASSWPVGFTSFQSRLESTGESNLEFWATPAVWLTKVLEAVWFTRTPSSAPTPRVSGTNMREFSLFPASRDGHLEYKPSSRSFNQGAKEE